MGNHKASGTGGERRSIGQAGGVPLWPDRFGDSALKKIRVAIGSVFWSALYQQDPTDKEGGLFQRKWFIEIDRLPSLNGNVPIRYWDLASTDPGKIRATIQTGQRELWSLLWTANILFIGLTE